MVGKRLQLWKLSSELATRRVAPDVDDVEHTFAWKLETVQSTTGKIWMDMMGRNCGFTLASLVY